MTTAFLPRLAAGDDGPAIRVGEAALTAGQAAGAAAAVAEAVRGARRVAVWAEPALETCVGAIGALAAGAAVVPLNPDYGSRELGHIAADARPELVLTRPGAALPAELAAVARRDVALAERSAEPLRDELAPEDVAFVLYTSGTTGPPKGALISRGAVTANLDALAAVWEWTAADRLVHALPLFHVHGLILGLLGPLRAGGEVEHVGRFAPDALAGALERGASMVFGVPTMYVRIANAAAADERVARAFAGARLLVSGSAGLPGLVHRRVAELTGRSIVERYGLTETLILTAAHPGRPEHERTVGTPLPAVELKLADDDGAPVAHADEHTIGELLARGPSVFAGYLNQPDATAAALSDGWFRTGDLATRAGAAYRIAGRRSTDLIKSGGYRIGAGEIEAALLEHPAVAEAAVAGRDDPDLGERVVAWVVREPGTSVAMDELREHVGGLLAPHKRPREVRFADSLPRNALGKVLKRELER